MASGRQRLRIALALGLWLGTAALFLPIRTHDFVPIDDPVYVSENTLLADALTGPGLRRTFTTAYFYNWHPLTTLSYALDYRLHGRAPGSYLGTNLLLHATATALLFLALHGLTGALGRSAFVAAVFGVHPLHVESVAWVSERKDVLSGLFFALVLWSWARYAKGPPRWTRRILPFVLLALGLLAKPMLVTVPFVLLLLDFWPLGRIPRERPWPALRALAWEKLPLFALAAVSSAITYHVQSVSGAVASFERVDLATRLSNAPQACLAYLEHAFWPRGLVFFYPLLPGELSPARGLLAALVLVALTAAAIGLRRRAPYALVGWLWFLGMLLPVIGLVQVGGQSMADHYTYLPLIGVAVVVAWGAFDLAGATRARRVAITGAAAAALAGLVVASAFQIRTWKDGESLATHALAIDPRNARAHFVLASTLLREGRTAEAALHAQAAVTLEPRRGENRGLLGDVLEREGRREEALAAYHDALFLDPSLARVRANLGKVLIDLGRASEAAAQLAQAAAAAPEAGRAEIAAQLARALAARGDVAGAIAQYEAALRVRPDFAEAHANLGLVLAGAGRPAEAEPHLRRALALGLDAPEVHAGLGDLLQRQGRVAEAAQELRAALRQRPEWIEPSNNLAWLLATADDPALRSPQEAVDLAETAANQSRRQDPSILDTLAVAYAAAGRRGDALVTAREALALARTQGRSDLLPTLEQRTRSYQHPLATTPASASH